MPQVIRKRIGSVSVILTPRGQKRILEINRAARKNPLGSVPSRYSFLHDIITPSNQEMTRRRNQIEYIITASSPPQGIRQGLPEKNSRTQRANGKIVTMYYTKRPDSSKPILFVKDQRDSKSRKLEKTEVEDAQRQTKVVGTPKYWAQISLANSRRTITVSEKISGAIPLDAFYQTATSVKKIEVLKALRATYAKLISSNAFPSQNKPDHIWVRPGKKLSFIITDAAMGPTPTNRNKLSILEALQQHRDIPRPNWGAIEKSFTGMKKYWNSLSTRHKRIVLEIELEQLIQEIQSEKQKRQTWQEIKKKVERLAGKLFPTMRRVKRTRGSI